MDDGNSAGAGILVFAIFAFFLFLLVWQTVKIVRPYQRGLVERLGRYYGTREPGMRIIIPFIDKMILVDMREQVVDVPPQEVITSDNVVVSVDAVIYYEATDPQRLVYNVANFQYAIIKLAQTNLRNVVGDLQLDEALTSRDPINTRLREILDDATDKWGARVVRVELQRIDPPPDVINSMHHQMKAERERRAVVTEAEGSRAAAITRAEGERQSAILSAEGQKQAQILHAQGQSEAIQRLADAEKYRQVQVAQGEADATRLVYSAIHEGDPSPDLVAIKYLEALRYVADGNATKIFLPTEQGNLFGLAGGLAALLERDETTASAG